jgi:hypothetical protein
VAIWKFENVELPQIISKLEAVAERERKFAN